MWGVGGGGGRWEVKGGRRGLKTTEILLAESCRKQVSFESGFKKWKGRRISEAGWQRVPDFVIHVTRTQIDIFVLHVASTQTDIFVLHVTFT